LISLIKIDQSARQHHLAAMQQGAEHMTIHNNPVGLDGVVAAATALSHVDGDKGELIIAGSRVDDLAAVASFEALTARVWSLAGDRQIDEAEVRALLGKSRLAAFRRLPSILPAAAGMSIVAGFRAAVAALRPEDELPHEAVLVGAMPVVAAALVGRRMAKRRSRPIPLPRTLPTRFACCVDNPPRRPKRKRSTLIWSP
jgi:citrate synthase